MKDIRKTSDPTFVSDVDAMSMELDMDDDLPQKKRFSRHTIYCILGTLALVAIATTIIIFDVQYNQMTGTLPSWMGDTMKNVRDLILSDNHFEGSLPESMTNMEHLTTLAINDNSFSGDVAAVVNSMGALKYLYADNNLFNSKIDFNFLTELMNLEELDLSGNQFTSDELSLHLFLMQSLRVLNLHDNALAGSILDAVPPQANLEFLSLYGNSLTGSIPQTIHELSGLTHLDLSRNLFTGVPPDSISYLEGLRYLYLSDNQFDAGEVPAFYQDLAGLEEFSMAKAKRTGTIPEWLADLNNLMLLDLSENELTGTIPDAVIDLPDLRFLLLHRNQLTGEIQEGMLRADNLGKSETIVLLHRATAHAIVTHSLV